MESKWREVAEALFSALNLVDTSDDYSPASMEVVGYNAQEVFRAVTLYEETLRTEYALVFCSAKSVGSSLLGLGTSTNEKK